MWSHGSWRINRFKVKKLKKKSLTFLLTLYKILFICRSALVNNNTLACISVRNKFHMHILSQNALLDETIAKFVDYQKNNGHECTDQVEVF